MSQHFYVTQTAEDMPVKVVAGWDRPLGYFFLVVENLSKPNEVEARFIYSNLDDPEGGFSQQETFDYYSDVLTRLGVSLPAEMVEALEEDRGLNRGNHVKDWTEDKAQA